MKKIQYLKGFLIAVLLVPVLVSCQQNKEAAQPKTVDKGAEAVIVPEPPFEPFQGRDVYLRGEMNEYGKQAPFLLKRVSEDEFKWCTLATLRSDWSPYRFKFADENWTAGTNFGYATPPAYLREGSAGVRLNPQSRFEELRYAPAQDGIYRFCIEYKEKVPYATVEYVEDAKLPSMGELIENNLAQ